MKEDTIVLEGRRVRLEPLRLEHLGRLCEIGLDPEMWRWVPTLIDTPLKMKSYLEEALAARAAGTAYPFVTIERESNLVLGSTRFGNIDLKNKRVEIGWTWLNSRWQRSFVNTEAKYLMLQYAFERLGCFRVELKTDALNEKSRAAIRRIGAKEEGILRKHTITHSGRMRDTIYYSILDTEWEGVKRTLTSVIEDSR